MIEEFPHLLLHYNFSRKKDRYFLSPYEVNISNHCSQKTVCDIIHSSDFLCALLDIDRPTNKTSTGSTTTTADYNPSPKNSEQTNRRALSCSTASEPDPLSALIEQRLDFKHRCMFYSTGPMSDLCGK